MKILMNRIWFLCLVLISFSFAPYTSAAKKDVLSIRELREFVATHYPRTNRGVVQVTLYGPSVEWIRGNTVRFSFNATAEPADRSVRYRQIYASVQGELFRSGSHLLLRNVEMFNLDARSVSYEHRTMVESHIQKMVISDFVLDPILEILTPPKDPRYYPNFDAVPVTIVNG